MLALLMTGAHLARSCAMNSPKAWGVPPTTIPPLPSIMCLRSSRLSAAFTAAFSLATTLILPGDEDPQNDPAAIRERLEHDIAAVIDAGACPRVATTVVDLSGDTPTVLRRGRGDPARLGL